MTDIDFKVYDLNSSGPKIRPQLQTHNRQILKAEAEMAKEMIKTGMIAGVHEKVGECEKMTLLTPDEVVQRACALAELAYTAFEERGWIYPVASYDEMIAELEREHPSQAVGFGQVQNGKEDAPPRRA